MQTTSHILKKLGVLWGGGVRFCDGELPRNSFSFEQNLFDLLVNINSFEERK